MTKDIALLIGYIKNQHNVIEGLIKQIKAVTPSNKEKTVYLGYLIHNLYCAFEELFQEIAKTFENRVENLIHYHRELLKRMIIEIPGVRPALLSMESFHLLDEIRGFRHIFRHSYDYELSSGRIKELKAEIVKGLGKIEQDISCFEGFLQGKLPPVQLG